MKRKKRKTSDEVRKMTGCEKNDRSGKSHEKAKVKMEGMVRPCGGERRWKDLGRDGWITEGKRMKLE